MNRPQRKREADTDGCRADEPTTDVGDGWFLQRMGRSPCYCRSVRRTAAALWPEVRLAVAADVGPEGLGRCAAHFAPGPDSNSLQVGPVDGGRRRHHFRFVRSNRAVLHAAQREGVLSMGMRRFWAGAQACSRRSSPRLAILRPSFVILVARRTKTGGDGFACWRARRASPIWFFAAVVRAGGVHGWAVEFRALE